MLGIMLLTVTALANDLLVPGFSAKPGSESAGAEMMYAATIDALRDRRIDFLDDNDIRTFTGTAGDNCSLDAACPANLWGSLEGRLAMVGTVGMSGDQITVIVEFYRPDVDGPVEFVQDELPTKNVHQLAVDLALIADDLLRMKETPPAGAAVAAAGLGAVGGAAATAAILGSLEDPSENGDGAAVASDPAFADAPPVVPLEEEPFLPQPEPAPEPAVVAEPAPKPVRKARPAPTATSNSSEQRQMGIPAYAYQMYQKSGKDAKQWMADEKVRSRRFFVEIHAGVALGDVKRRYATRVAVQEEGEGQYYTLAYYERDNLLPGAAFSVATSFGYTPVWWFEGGLLMGIEFPQKELITGWEAYTPDNEYGDRDPASSDQVIYPPATAMTLLLEPRVRFLFLPIGIVKPFGLLGWSTRFYDRYETPDLAHVKFPDRTGIVSSGPTAGFGLSYDPQHRASGFIESTFTKLVGPKIVDQGRENMSRIPEPDEGSGIIATIRAGVTTRF
jgi:hypothetical protein